MTSSVKREIAVGFGLKEKGDGTVYGVVSVEGFQPEDTGAGGMVMQAEYAAALAHNIAEAALDADSAAASENYIRKNRAPKTGGAS